MKKHILPEFFKMLGCCLYFKSWPFLSEPLTFLADPDWILMLIHESLYGTYMSFYPSCLWEMLSLKEVGNFLFSRQINLTNLNCLEDPESSYLVHVAFFILIKKGYLQKLEQCIRMCRRNILLVIRREQQ